MREPNPSYLMLANGDIDALLAHHKSLHGNAVMTADPAQAAPPAAPPGGLVLPPTTFDPQTGDPIPVGAPDPNGVWGAGVVPPAGVQTVPAPTAPDPTQPPPPPPSGQPFIEIEGQRYFTQDFLEQARREERDRLHNKVESIEAEMKAQREAREAEIAAAQNKAAEEAAEAERLRLQALPLEEKVNEIQQTWEKRWAARDEMDQRRAAIEAQEATLREVEAFRARRINEESALIHPTLVDYITGYTTEEIEQSISAAKSKTDAIVQTLQGQQTMQRQQARGVAPTGAPPVGPLDTTQGYQSVSAQDIAQMDPATYAKNRPALMEAMRQKVAQGGLYQS